MSPILTRPVREQFEHDRIIRLLQARYRRKFDVVINPGPEQNAPVDVGGLTMYPDVVLFSQERGRRLQGTIEVETTESVNTLEAMAEWGPFSRLRAPFILYVPPHALDTARRLCTEHGVKVAEIWTYHMAIDQVRFTMVHRSPDIVFPRAKAAPAEKKRVAAKRPRATKTKGAAPKSSRSARAASGKKAAARLPARAGTSSRAAKKPAPKKAAKAGKRR